MTLDASPELRQIPPRESEKAHAAIQHRGYDMLALTIAFWLALLMPTVVGSAYCSVMRAVAVLVIAALSVAAGRILGILIRLPNEAGFAAAFEVVIGFCALSLLHLSITAAFHLQAVTGLMIDIVIIGTFFLLAQRREPVLLRSDTRVLSSQPWYTQRAIIDAIMLVAISVLVTIWTRDALSAVREAHTSGILRVWNDFLLQAAEINYQKGYPWSHGQSLFLAGTPQPFYHRASYSLSAMYAAISHEPALDTSVYFWMPTGITLMGMGAYGLGSALGGRMAGIVAALALFLLPDASMYGLHNGYFAFHWLIQVAPGSGYALALALIGLAVYVRGVRDARFELVMIGALPAVAAATFRVHIAIPAVATFIIMMMLAWRPKHPWHRVAAVIVLLVGGAVAVVGSEHITFAPHFLTAQRDGLRYIDAVHAATPISYTGLYGHWTAGDTDFQKGVIGYSLLLVAELGALLPLLLVYVIHQMRAASGRWEIYVVPLVLMCVHCAITFLMPTASNGDITEWSHRSFVIVYAVLLIYVVAWITSLVAAAVANRPGVKSPAIAAAAILVIAGSYVPWHFGKNAQYGSLRDGPTACRTPISADMFATTDYIREHAQRGDKLLLSDDDPLALGVALSGVGEYLSRGSLYKALGGKVADMAAERTAENSQLAGIHSFDELKAFGQKTGVRWYLLQQADMPQWPASLLAHAAFTSGTMRVFDLQQ